MQAAQSKRPILRPMPGKIVVEVIGEREFMGKSGLILRNAARPELRTTGVVVAVYESFLLGVNETETESYVKVGNKVIFGMHSGLNLDFDGWKVIVLREQEILVIVEADDETIVQSGVVSDGSFDELEG